MLNFASVASNSATVTDSNKREGIQRKLQLFATVDFFRNMECHYKTIRKIKFLPCEEYKVVQI
jgi:hypothetical protein